MKTVDFVNIMVRPDLSSEEKVQVNIAKELGNAIYKEAKTLDMDLLARLIYDSKGPIAIRDEDAEYIKNTFIVKLPYFVQKEILPSL